MERFTRSQILRLANIFDNAGQVLLATVVLPQLLSREPYISDPKRTTMGIVSTIAAWWVSLRFERIGTA